MLKAEQAQCSVAGCERPHYCRGLCSRHYQFDLRRGSRLAAPKKPPGAKLTKEQVRTIRKMRARGIMLKTLAACFGVDANTIWKVAARRTWV